MCVQLSHSRADAQGLPPIIAQIARPVKSRCESSLRTAYLDVCHVGQLSVLPGLYIRRAG